MGREDSAGNNLLATLRNEDFAKLQPSLERVRLERGTVIYRPGDEVRFAYFPCGASLTSFMILGEDGKSAEIASIGREGALGGIVSQGRLPAYAQSVVLFEGDFLRAETAALGAAKLQSPGLRHLFARYSDCLLAQVFQQVACNAAHSIEQRTAKWLLAAAERIGDHNIVVTQELLASMLGVGRSYLSRTLYVLRARGVLTVRRGGLALNDLRALKDLACTCNEAVRLHFEEVLQGVYPSELDPIS
jgi:CRP-like cAMP-binding protein